MNYAIQGEIYRWVEYDLKGNPVDAGYDYLGERAVLEDICLEGTDPIDTRCENIDEFLTEYKLGTV